MKKAVFLMFSLYLVFSSSADAKDPWIRYAAGGYNGKILIFDLPSLNLLKEVPAGVDLRGPVLSGNKQGNTNGTPDGKMLYAVDKAANTVVFFCLLYTSPSPRD